EDRLSNFKELTMNALMILRKRQSRRQQGMAKRFLHVEPLEARNLLDGGFANILVNNPNADSTAQDTQSETAIVLGSGSRIVVAFNDSGFHLKGDNQATGYAFSPTGGDHFADQGTLPSSPDGDAGDPALARSVTTGTIFLSTLTANPDFTLGLEKIDV